MDLQELTARRALELPATSLTHPFGDGWDVFRVLDKVFMLHTEVAGEPIVVLKAAPDDGEALRAAHPGITPGYHMNKRHWITVHPGADLPPGMVDELVVESYLQVVEHNIPRRDWPVDPKVLVPGR